VGGLDNKGVHTSLFIRRAMVLHRFDIPCKFATSQQHIIGMYEKHEANKPAFVTGMWYLRMGGMAEMRTATQGQPDCSKDIDGSREPWEGCRFSDSSIVCSGLGQSLEPGSFSLLVIFETT
jgi:hypothetical protein